MITNYSCLLFLEVRERLKGFQIYGYIERSCQNGWCMIYNDNGRHQYDKDKIEIKVDPVQSVSKVAIRLPKHKGEITYLTLCEVEIIAGITLFLCISSYFQDKL